MVFKILGQMFSFGSPKTDRAIEVTPAPSGRGLPIVYGRRKLKPSIVYAAVSRHNGPEGSNRGDFSYPTTVPLSDDEKIRNNLDWLYTVNAYCAGPIEGYDYFLVSGERHSIRRFSNKPYLRLAGFNGSENQTPYTALTTVASQTGGAPSWTTSHKGDGCAYTVARYLNRKKKPQFKSQPTLEAVLRGIKVYDPRDVTQTATDVNSWRFSENRALVILDYLTSANGAALSLNDVDLPAFEAVANQCDAAQTIPVVPAYSVSTYLYDIFEGTHREIQPGQTPPDYRPYQVGSSQGRHMLGASLDPQKTVADNLKSLLEGGPFSLAFTNGKYRLLLEDETLQAAMHLDETTVTGKPTVRRASRRERLNRVTVNFPNAERDFEQDSVTWPTKDDPEFAAYQAEDNDQILKSTVTVTTITDFYRAEAYAEYLVKRSRADLQVAGLKCSPKASLLEPGDVVTIHLPDYELYQKHMLVDSVSMASNLDVTLDLLEYDPSIYQESERHLEPYVASAPLGEMLEDPEPVQGFAAQHMHDINADGTAVSGFDITWSEPETAAGIRRYIVQWRPAADPTDEEGYLYGITLPSTSTSANIRSLIDKKDYDIRIYYETFVGSESDPVVLPAQHLPEAETGFGFTGDIANGTFAAGEGATGATGWVLPTGATRIDQDDPVFGSLVTRGRFGVLIPPVDPSHWVVDEGLGAGGQILFSTTDITSDAGEAVQIVARVRAASDSSPTLRVWVGLATLDETGSIIEYQITDRSRNGRNGTELKATEPKPVVEVMRIPAGATSTRAFVLVENSLEGSGTRGVVISLVDARIVPIPSYLQDATEQPGGPADPGATEGATAGDNLTDSAGNPLGDADVITEQGTADNTKNVGDKTSQDLLDDVTLTLTDYNDAQAIANDNQVVFYQASTEPPTGSEGDVWLDSSVTPNRRFYRHDGTAYRLVTSGVVRINCERLLAAAQQYSSIGLKLGRVGFFFGPSITAPISPTQHDVWQQTDTGLVRVYNGTEWASHGFILLPAGDGATDPEGGQVSPSDIVKADPDVLEMIEDLEQSKAARDDEIDIYEGPTAPTGSFGLNDGWYDTGQTPNVWHRWNGTIWTADAKQRLIDRYEALRGVLGAEALADGKATLFTTATGTGSDPIGTDGDLWSPSNTETIYRWQNGGWVQAAKTIDRTSEITDDAGLGSKAVWSLVADDGNRPEDNATNTTLTSQLSDDAELGLTARWDKIPAIYGRPATGATVGAPAGTTVGSTDAATVEANAQTGFDLTGDNAQQLHPSSYPDGGIVTANIAPNAIIKADEYFYTPTSLENSLSKSGLAGPAIGIDFSPTDWVFAKEEGISSRLLVTLCVYITFKADSVVILRPYINGTAVSGERKYSGRTITYNSINSDGYHDFMIQRDFTSLAAQTHNLGVSVSCDLGEIEIGELRAYAREIKK